MGAITDMILDGILCEECGIFIDEDFAGHPRKCDDCKREKTNNLRD